MSYAIIRVEKLKSRQAITESFRHMCRTKKAPTANPALRHLNKVIIGSMSAKEDFEKKLATVDNIQKNAVLGVEVLMTTSPDWWQTATKEMKTDWLKSSVKYLADTFGKSNITHLQLHLDERTPHLTGMIIPRIKKYVKSREKDEVKLSASTWFDGAHKMIALQDGYHQAVEHLGLERGERNSQTQHERPNTYLDRVQKQKVEQKEIELIKTGFGGFVDIVTKPDFIESINKQISEVNDFATFVAKTNEKLKEEKKVVRKQASRIAQENENLKDQIQQVTALARELPLLIVAQKLGLVQTSASGDEIVFEDELKEHKFSIKDNVFYDFKKSQGGKGAIDLVKSVLDSDFKSARSWLIDNFNIEDVISLEIGSQMKELLTKAEEIKKEVKKRHDIKPEDRDSFVPPKREHGNIHAVFNYLTKVRNISQKTVKDCMKKNLVYADKMKNAVFIYKTFCEKIGTGPKKFKGSVAGSNKQLNAWRYVANEVDQHKRLVVCESPIDAMSYKDLNDDLGTFAATGGVTPFVPGNLKNAPWEEIIIAYDNDKVGMNTAKRLKDDFHALGYKNVIIEHSSMKDWNDELKSKNETNRFFK